MRGFAFILISGIFVAGCANVDTGEEQPNTPEVVSLAAYQAGAAQAQSDPVVARVNGREIKKSALLAVLLRGRGKTILDELVLREIVRQRAQEAGITIEPTLAQKELERVLEEMGPGKSRLEQEALLRYMLKSRGLTRQEFELILERQALLQKLVDDKVEISAEELNREYARRYGRKVQVRHLAVRNLQQMDKAQERLREGEDFARITQEMSQDEVTLARGGLWGPMSAGDEQIPAVVRQAALGLERVGQRSEVIRYKDDKGLQWWCLLQLEEITKADEVEINEVHRELTETIKQQEIGRRMFELQEQLKRQARIEVLDPILQKDDSD